MLLDIIKVSNQPIDKENIKIGDILECDIHSHDLFLYNTLNSKWNCIVIDFINCIPLLHVINASNDVMLNNRIIRGFEKIGELNVTHNLVVKAKNCSDKTSINIQTYKIQNHLNFIKTRLTKIFNREK